MGLKVLKCENCGAKIEQTVENKILYCSHCGAKFSQETDIYNTFVTNNQNITKVFMGKSAHEEINQEKIIGYIQRLYDAMEQGNFSEAKDYCVTILNKDPYNKIAITIKGFLSEVLKKENGRYKTLEIEDVFIFIQYLTNQPNINEYIEIFDLAQRLLEATATMPSNEVIELCKNARKNVKAINNEYTKSFLNILLQFQNGIEQGVIKIEEDERELQS